MPGMAIAVVELDPYLQPNKGFICRRAAGGSMHSMVDLPVLNRVKSGAIQGKETANYPAQWKKLF